MVRAVVMAATIGATSAIAQDVEVLNYTGRVLEISDNSGAFAAFEIGQNVSGSIGLDLSTEVTEDSLGGVFPIGIFALPTFTLNTEAGTFEGTGSFAALFNDLNSQQTDDGFADVIRLEADIEFNGQQAGMAADFIGNGSVFEAADILEVSTVRDLNLDQLLGASVSVSFFTFDPDAPIGSLPVKNEIVIEVLDLFSGAQSIVQLANRADVNLNGEVDVGDFSTFLSLFAAGSLLADQDSDGTVSLQDFTAFLNNFANAAR